MFIHLEKHYTFFTFILLRILMGFFGGVTNDFVVFLNSLSEDFSMGLTPVVICGV